MRNKISLITILLVLTVISITCKKTGPVDPPEENKPGRRDYTWTVDTLKVSDGNTLYLFSLWGSSPNDVWAVGHGSSYSITMWHYDGVSWKVSDARLSSNFMSVYGFANNNVWACDAPGAGVYHYNGVQWSNAFRFDEPDKYLGLNSIWGDAPDNVFAVGGIDTISTGNYKGAILHYDGNSWKILSIPDIRVGFINIRRGITESNKYYIAATRFESTGDTNKIYEYDGSNLKEIYSSRTVAAVCEMAGKLYFPINRKIFKYHNDKFELWKDFSSTIYKGWITGRSEMDFFAISSTGLAHYNGTDLETLYQTNLPVLGTIVFEKDIFFINNFNMIVHGKLK